MNEFELRFYAHASAEALSKQADQLMKNSKSKAKN